MIAGERTTGSRDRFRLVIALQRNDEAETGWGPRSGVPHPT